MTKELIRFGMTLVQHVPVSTVDALLLMIANFIFGDLSRHGIVRPKMGPLLLKSKTGRSAVIDVGTVRLIKEGVIKVSVLSRYKFILRKISNLKRCYNIFVSPLGVERNI